MFKELFTESSGINEGDQGIGIRKFDKMMADDPDWEITAKPKGQKGSQYGMKISINRREIYCAKTGVTAYVTHRKDGTFDSRITITAHKDGWKTKGENFISVHSEYNLSGALQALNDKYGKSNPKSRVKPMTSKEFKNIMKDYANVAKDFKADGMKFGDAEAFEVATNIISEYPNIVAYINTNLRVPDAQGWLANQL